MKVKNSFYDLDYIIEINETRLEQYRDIYQKSLEKLTNIVIIYSSIFVFLVPIIEDLIIMKEINWIMSIAFICFISLFTMSLFYTVKLIMPTNIAYLDPPKIYYSTILLRYEGIYPGETTKINQLIKSSYIDELEQTIEMNTKASKDKNSHYYNSLIYSLMSVIPFTLCLGIHLTK